MKAEEYTRLLAAGRLVAAHEAIWEIPAENGTILRRLSTEEHEAILNLAAALYRQAPNLLARLDRQHALAAESSRKRDALVDLLARIWETVPAEYSGPAVERHAAALNEIPGTLRKAGR